MKKIIGFFIALTLLVTLVACGKKPKATVENQVVKRSSCTFDLKVDDKDIVTKGSVLVNFYKISKKEETLFTTKTLTTFSETVTVTGLSSDTKYRADVVCTYNKKAHTIYSWAFTTIASGTEYDPIVISSADELIDCMANDYSSDAFYCLANDIDFSGKSDFTGVSATSSAAFCGHLDGKNFKIKNVTISSNQTYNGFFGYLKGTVENITFENVNVSVERSSSTTTYSGIVCGYAYQAKLNDVKVTKSKLTVDCKTQYNGGLVGYSFASNINYCDLSEIEINSKSGSTVYTGGFTAYLCQNSSNKYGKIYNSQVSGTVSVTGATTLNYGGAVGALKAGASVDRIISNIDATINTTGLTKVGGIIGQANLNSVAEDTYVKNVVAKGKITYKTFNATELTEATDTVMIGGLIGSATAVIVDSAYVEMDLDIEAKIAENKDLYSGLAFGNGFEAHTELHKAIINGTITAVTSDSHVDANINIHGYDGSTYINAGDENPSSTIDKDNVKYVKIEIDIDGATQTYPSPIEIQTSQSQASWDSNIWSVELDGTDKLTIKFKN